MRCAPLRPMRSRCCGLCYRTGQTKLAPRFRLGCGMPAGEEQGCELEGLVTAGPAACSEPRKAASSTDHGPIGAILRPTPRPMRPTSDPMWCDSTFGLISHFPPFPVDPQHTYPPLLSTPQAQLLQSWSLQTPEAGHQLRRLEEHHAGRDREGRRAVEG